jgi:CubicO group peptidase (beta-lactamase class C family)
VRQPGFSRRDTTIDAMIADIVQRPLDFVPGSEQSYSNPGYILLGGVIEKITGQAWHQALDEQLLAPLGLTDTRFDDTGALIPGRVAGYTIAEDRPANAPFVSMTTVASAGGLLSTVADLTRWMALLAEGRVISPDSFSAMATPTAIADKPPVDPYGFGLYIWRIRGEIALGHTGQVNGFASALAYLPRTRHVLAVLANSDTFDARIFVRRMGAMAMNRPFPRVVAVPPPPAMLQSLPGAYGNNGTPMWTIIKEGPRLYAQRPGRNRIALQMSSEGTLHFDPDALTFFRPLGSGKDMRLEYARDGEVPGTILTRIG